MQTFRADIDAVNDNRTRSRAKIMVTILALLCALGVFGYVKAKAYLFDGLPSLPDKATMWELNLQPNTTLLDKNGAVLGHRGPYVGRPLKLAEMPNHLPQAFLAIEDERFYQHAGIDRRAILRAFFENQKSGSKGQGGSTLTQQLVKNMVLTPEKTYRRKFQEAWLAYEMETVLSKPEILELYLNRVDLGNRTFGVEAAAQRYFGKSATDISRSEAALLAALPQAPSRYNPTKNFDGAWDRAKLVLRRMLTNTMITPSELAEAESNPPVIIAEAEDAIDQAMIGHVFDLIQEQAKGLIGSGTKDLVIRTTLDPALQKYAHDSLETVLSKQGKTRKVSNGAMVTLDNETGAVRAMIGGRDYSASKFNRAVQAERQPGSSFKALVYAAALEDGFTPATVRIDQPTEIAGWAPENYTRRYRGPMTIREALKLSINTVAAQVGAEIGPPRVVDLAKRFGISTNMRSTYSIALGASEVTLLDLSQAFMVFANEGIRKPPYLIESISNSANESLYKRRALTPARVYAASYAQQMNSMLSDVIESGTGRGAKLGNRPAGGKTGTTQDYRDAWFAGFTEQYTTGVWMGNDDNSSMSKVTGGLLPVDAWKAFMVKAHKGIKIQPLSTPQNTESDARRKRMAVFYKDLSEALIQERNLAAGITTGPRASAAPTTGAN